MNQYTSLSHSFRGFNIQSDFGTSGDWEQWLESQPDFDWSVLVEVETGTVVRRYKRGIGVE